MGKRLLRENRRLGLTQMKFRSDTAKQIEMQEALRNSIRASWLIFAVLVTLVGLSITIRGEQVDRVLHASAPTTMTAKADVPSPASASVPQPLPMIRSRMVTSFAMLIQVPARTTIAGFSAWSLWYSVFVRHRPPPQNFA